MIFRRRTTGREVVLFGRCFRPSKRHFAALILGSTAVTGCATLGGNVKGSFTCDAPEGICAPSSVIDDRALAMISGDEARPVPAGPYTQPEVVRPQLAAAQGVTLAGPKVLRIVFPSYVDQQGRFHETSVVRAMVDNGAWIAATAERGPIVASADGLRIEQPAQADPVAYASAVTPSPALASKPPTAATPPSPDKVAAARQLAQAQSASPARPGLTPPATAPVLFSREQIAADVEKVLRSPTTPLNKPTSFSGRVED